MDVPYVLFVPILSIMFLSLFFISYFVILLIFSYSMTIKKLAKPLCLFLFFSIFLLTYLRILPNFVLHLVEENCFSW